MVSKIVNGIVVLALGAMAGAAMAQSSTTTPLTYQGKPVNGYLGGNADFPAEFLGTLCEGGRSAPGPSASCVVLNRDGTGTWENDVGIGQRRPPTPIKWYVVADQQGTVTRASDEERDTYFLIFEYTASYYSRNPGDLMAMPAVRVKGSPGRVVIGGKYRDLG